MAFELKNSKKLVSDINVTPLVDVMLVLLIIFMITAPLMLNGIALNLPKTKEVNRMNLTAEQVVLSVTRTGEYYIGKEKFLYSELVPEINARFKKNNTTTVYLRADFDLRYGKVAVLMSQLKKAGITNIALVTEIEDN